MPLAIFLLHEVLVFLYQLILAPHTPITFYSSAYVQVTLQLWSIVYCNLMDVLCCVIIVIIIFLLKPRAVFSLYGWRFPLPYCNNSAGESSSNGNGSSYTSDVEKVPLPDMNFVL